MSAHVQVESRSLADIATAVWRLHAKLADQDSPARRHAQTAMDALAEAGIEVQSHRDRDYDPGMAIRVLAFQPRPGLTKETIVETVRPTIYLHGQVIGMGEVIVGIPSGEAQ
ncbi:hypothetical protein [Allokutzneria sp. NRRL B-24872]|uniref:hypothetical protein n=1 Tax=Allokutzneria sp. NRRL B-24872 TaxID=1137961 RepID=UPI000A396437|nr:hypothetical protein [Allokutzneria sp. NRRL B-24872]